MLEIIPPTSQLSGKVILPGSKSITNRALLIAALADEVSEIRGALKSDDTKYMSDGLRKFGIVIDEPDATTFVVHGKGGKLVESTEPIFLGNAGTATRFLSAAAILVNGETTIDGDKHMRERPIKDLVDALIQLGAKIEYLGKEGCPPIKIISDGKPKATEEIKVRRDTSSQFLSAILMIWPFIEGEKSFGSPAAPEVSPGYIGITMKVMESFGIKFGKRFENAPGFSWIIKDGRYLTQKKYLVEPDASAATYFWAVEKLLNQKIEIENLPDEWIQPDALTEEIIEKFPNLPSEINGIKFPDAVPTLAVLAAFSGREILFTGIANLRVKECDRIRALAVNLNKIKSGLAKEVGDDLIIFGDENLATTGKTAVIETFDDHRIAMSFALAGLRIPGIKIDKPDCVAKSFPNFWKIWDELGVKFLK